MVVYLGNYRNLGWQ